MKVTGQKKEQKGLVVQRWLEKMKINEETPDEVIRIRLEIPNVRTSCARSLWGKFF